MLSKCATAMINSVVCSLTATCSVCSAKTISIASEMSYNYSELIVLPSSVNTKMLASISAKT